MCLMEQVVQVLFFKSVSLCTELHGAIKLKYCVWLFTFLYPALGGCGEVYDGPPVCSFI